MASLAYQLADRILDGGVAAYIRSQQDEGASYETIARDLTARLGASVTGETVRRWSAEDAA